MIAYIHLIEKYVSWNQIKLRIKVNQAKIDSDLNNARALLLQMWNS